MSDLRLCRVTKEIARCNTEYKTENIRVKPVDDSPFHLRASFQGPKDSPYEGGTFEVDIVFPDGYPNAPPNVKFATKVYHPNISYAGTISIDILRNRWSPAISLPVLLLSLQSFLCSPELCDSGSDDVNPEVAKLFASSRQAFEDTARSWTRKYTRKSSHP